MARIIPKGFRFTIEVETDEEEELARKLFPNAPELGISIVRKPKGAMLSTELK